jgi:phage protein D/phage baseplate assembly protein gpV
MTMPQTPPVVSQISIKLDGTAVQHNILTLLAEAEVDQHAYLPGMFTLSFFDSDLALLDQGPFDLTKKVTIAMEDEAGHSFVLIEGEITALEPIFREGMVAELVVRGYDKSHRLFRETKSQAFLNKKDSDLANEIARAADLRPEVEATSIVYDHIFQDNQSDLSFLTQRAWRIGYECYVSEGKLYFRKPPAEESGVTLEWGRDMISFRPRMTLAEQVNEVVVRGWDPRNKAAIVGRAESGKLYPKIKEPKDGAAWAQAFGRGKTVIVNQPVVSQAEADALAAARLNELSGAFIEAEGEAYRRPDIKAGRMLELKGLGKRFSGKYLVTSATHTYTPAGLKTVFTVRGARTGLFNEQVGDRVPFERWPGAVTAIVTNTDDPKNWGRVKVKYPWVTDEAESDWARLIGPGGGAKAGFLAIPDVGDEVLVVFEHGDFNRPFVLGGLWNGKDAIPPKTDSAGTGEKPLIRTWCSRKGHRITVYDTQDNKVEIVTVNGHQLTLDDANKKISLTSSGGAKVVIDDGGQKVTVESSGEVEMKANTNLKIQAGMNVDIQASGQVNIKGAMVNLN